MPDADNKQPPARRLFRQLAAVIAVICFVLAPVYAYVVREGRWVGIVIFLVVGFVMLTIAKTGYWPRKR